MELPKVDLYDFLQVYPSGVKSNNRLVNIRGTNGSGKSSIPLSFLKEDTSSFELIYYYENKPRVIATVFPQFGWLAMGSYRTKCGGLDSYKTNEQTFDSIDLLWELDFNIIMEGVISSTVRGSYLEFFTKVNSRHVSQREITIYTLLPPFEVCLSRIQSRNGGKAIKSDQVLQKYEAIERNVQHFKNAGLVSLALDNSQVSLEQTLQWFLTNLGMSANQPDFAPTQRNRTGDETVSQSNKNGILMMPSNELEHYEWFPYYQQPNNKVVVDETSLQEYWYWIHERQEIWDKRVNKGLPAPWTQDIILREYKFTNACRNLDRLSIFYIKNILSRLEDTEESRKEVILNTMIYRLFCRLETWEMFGFLELKDWDAQWENAQRQLRKRKASGQPVFTDAYYVFGLHSVSPSPDNHDKTENAINLIKIWHSQLDEIYKKVVFSKSMKDALAFLKTLPCVGHFNAYEFACDFAWSHQYTDVQLVPWTIDSYTNVGPGAKRGLEYIFQDKGNLSDLQCIIYLRSIAKLCLKEYGFEDLKLPPEVPELDLRCIEHSLCEYQKYRKAKDGTGRPKVKFSQKTQNLDKLKL